MKALCWNGVNDLRVERVPDPSILNPHDVILKVRLSSVCGSDLHLLDGYIPTMQPGDIIGHEFLGDVVETGAEVKNLKRGDRVIGISIIGCGHCYFCQHELWSLCDNSNTNPTMMKARTENQRTKNKRASLSGCEKHVLFCVSLFAVLAICSYHQGVEAV